MLSKITDKYQTTVPKAVREYLKLAQNDTLEWRLNSNGISVLSAAKPLLELKGIVDVPHGDIKSDIQKARILRLKRYK